MDFNKKENDILMKVLELVKMVEKDKINIGNNTKINLCLLFAEIDSDNDGEIGYDDLYQYVQKENMIYSKKECEYFIRYYDNDYSSGLSFDEFVNVFLSLYHNQLNEYLGNNIFIVKENDIKDKEYINTLINSIFYLLSFLGKTSYDEDILFNNKEKISKNDFDIIYKDIDKQDREILFNFLDWNKDKVISKEDIKETFFPFKDNTYTQSESYQLEISLTKDKICEYYSWINQIEAKLEEKRICLFKNEEITVNNIFSIFNVNEKEYITVQNIFDVLKYYNMYIDIDIIDLLFNTVNVREQGKLYFEELLSLFLPYDKQINNNVSLKVTFLSMKESTKKEIVNYLYSLIKAEQSIEEKKEEIFQWNNHIIKLQNTYYVFNPKFSSLYISKEEFQSITQTSFLLWNRLTKRRNTDKIMISSIIQSLLPYNTKCYLKNYTFLP